MEDFRFEIGIEIGDLTAQLSASQISNHQSPLVFAMFRVKALFLQL